MNQVYLDLLHRPIDGAGLAFWEGRLNAGASRYSVVLAIESSREFALTTLTDLSQSLVGDRPDGVDAEPGDGAPWPGARRTRRRWNRSS